jgi:hypothetical protein
MRDQASFVEMDWVALYPEVLPPPPFSLQNLMDIELMLTTTSKFQKIKRMKSAAFSSKDFFWH